MTVYTDPFGGSTVQPAQVSYAAIALTADATLAWPADSYSSDTLVFARLCDVTPSSSGFALTLPDARRVSAGYDGFFNNRGGQAFTVESADGATVATVAAGEVRYVYLVNNATEAGTWRSFNMGALTSTTDAASLAGAGVAANGTTLNASRPTETFTSDYAVVAADLAKNFVWTNGTGTLTLPSLSAVGTDFFFSVVNQGTGVLTVTPVGSDTVDASAVLALQPSESAFVMAGPSSEWYSLGRGRSTLFDFTLLTKALTGGTTTLTPSEASNVAHRYTGTLGSEAFVVLPQVVQIYYITNATGGAYDLTFKTTASGGTTITIPQGDNAILFCDGTNVINASTTAAGISVLNLGAGSVSSPSVAFPDGSGIYQPSSSAVAHAIASVQRLLVNASGISVTGTLAVSGAASAGGAVTAATAPSLGDHLTNKTYVDAAIAASAGATLLPRAEKTANYTVVLGDLNKLVIVTANSVTLSFDPAATLTSGWWVYVANTGTGDVTLDPSGSETIDGLASFVMYPGETRLITCDGAALYSSVLTPFQRRFDANGTFTKPPGYQRFDGRLWGGGGGGGKGDGTGSGGGGGGGACVPFSLLATAVGTTETVTIAAAAAGASSAASGAAGNSSSFGSLFTVYGGGGGGSVAGGNSAAGGGGGGALGAGGSASGATAGTAGAPSLASSGSDVDGFGGARSSGRAAYGGSSGAVGVNTPTGGAGPVALYGGGGGGGSATTTPGAGGVSTFGGSGGAGGTASTSGTAGTRPGGGGGGTMNGTQGGDGAGGRLDIWGA